MAIEQRQPDGVLLHHSDRGAQYTSEDFRDEFDKHGIKCSMSASILNSSVYRLLLIITSLTAILYG